MYWYVWSNLHTSFYKLLPQLAFKVILMYIYTNIFHVRFLSFFQCCTEGKWQILVMFLTNDICCCCFLFNNKFSYNIIRYKRLNNQGTCMFNINNFIFFFTSNCTLYNPIQSLLDDISSEFFLILYLTTTFWPAFQHFSTSKITGAGNFWQGKTWTRNRIPIFTWLF